MFRSSFESLGNGTIDLDHAVPANGSRVSAELNLRVRVGFTYSGNVTPGVVGLFVDGVDVTASSSIGPDAVSYEITAPFSLGPHTVQVRVGSVQGSWSFMAISPPTVDAFVPSGSLPFGSTPELSAHFSDPLSAIDAASIRLTMDDVDVTAQAQLQWASPNEGTIRFQATQPPSTGPHTVILQVANQAGAMRPALTLFSVTPAAQYTVAFDSPLPGAILLQPALSVRASAGSNSADVLELSVNGMPGIVLSHAAQPRPFSADVVLQPGENALTAVAQFDNGEERTQTINVTYDAPPQVTITAPADLSVFGPVPAVAGTVPGGAMNLTGTVQRPIAISGTLSRPVTAVTVNQQQAVLAPGGRSFSFEQFFLHEGTNLLSVNAVDELNRVGTAQLTVYVDQTAPLVTVESPLTDAVTSSERIDVRGIANDAVEAGVNAPEPGVDVRNNSNGMVVAAQVADRYYLGRDIPLELGRNQLTVIARDAQGNTRSRSLEVTRIAAGSRRLTLLSGDRQAGPVNSVAAAPLRIVAVDPEGLPLAGLPVRFDVIRGAGSLRRVAGEEVLVDGIQPSRNLVVTTNASGEAEAWLMLGSEAAQSGNMVRAWADDQVEDVLFTATGLRGTPAWVMINGMSGSQYVQASSQPLEPLSVVVLDADRNAMSGQRIRFLVELGDALFNAQSAPNGTVSADGSSVVVTADKNGVASVRPVVGPTPGVVRVRAQAMIDESLFGGADFQLIVLERRNGPTGFSGVVLDHIGTALAGVQLSIGRTALSTVSDADGKFSFDDQVPPGKIDLHVDGTAIQIVRDGQTLQYPGLHFETAIVQGQMNQLPHPIYLPPVNLGQAKIVGGNEDVRLTIPGLDGFAMIVKANSVTFPDGTRQGPLVVTPVNGDRLPMVPPGGFASFGALAWTIQPTGTRFDPPIEVQIPNTAGLKRGETLPIVQWDHDLATFVPMGRGTVSEDGTRIVSDAGSGITKAGWGGGPPPVPPNCGDNPPPVCRGGQCSDCPDCQVRGAATAGTCPACAPDAAKVGKACNSSNSCRRCNSRGTCVADPARFPEVGESTITKIDIPDPEPESENIDPKAEFFGYRDSTRPATWEFEIEPYCVPEGKWKFRITKAEIKARIVIDSNPTSYAPLSASDIASHTEPNAAAYCRYYNDTEFSLRWSASSHYNNGTDYDSGLNPDIGIMQAAGWSTTTNVFDRVAEIQAHEMLHFRRLKEYAYLGWDTFKNTVANLEVMMVHYPTMESARNSPFVDVSFTNAITVMHNTAKRALATTGGFGGHASPDEFYACSLQALSPEFSALDAGRVQHSCPTATRPAITCPADAHP